MGIALIIEKWQGDRWQQNGENGVLPNKMNSLFIPVFLSHNYAGKIEQYAGEPVQYVKERIKKILCGSSDENFLKEWDDFSRLPFVEKIWEVASVQCCRERRESCEELPFPVHANHSIVVLLQLVAKLRKKAKELTSP